MSHTHSSQKSCCVTTKRTDWILWSASFVIIIAYGAHLILGRDLLMYPQVHLFTSSVFTLMNKMWWGILLGVLSVGFLGKVPREMIMTLLGKGGSLNGILRATGAGVLLDLCSHGILLVGMKLYERGASLGQVMAFLIASPWNSLSLTLILWSLVGFQWMITFLLISMVIAILSGLFFDRLVKQGTLRSNPHITELPEDYKFWKQLAVLLRSIRITPQSVSSTLLNGIKESRMILRWILFGVVLAALIRTFFSPDLFSVLFGPSLMGLAGTLIFATILEVCSEGSMPVASDILLRAKAPGNAFAFLMVGVSTDYTEILSIKETTNSWKVAFFLPLVTLPQVIIIALFLNSIAF